MTVSYSTPPINEYIGNGVTVAFPTTFTYAVAAEVEVYLDGVLTLSGYTTTDAHGSTGTVTFDTAPADLVQVTLRRLTPRTQELVTEASPDYADYEAQADRVVRMVQELDYDLSRTITVPVGSDPDFSGALPTPPESGQLALVMNSTGMDLSTYDPDAAYAKAVEAVTTAEAADATAEAAAALAEAALAATNNFGEVPRGGVVTLVEGQSTYDTLLATDDTVGDVKHFSVEYGQITLRPGTDFTLAGNGRGVVFAATVIAAASVPAAGEMVADETFYWQATPSLTGLDIGIGAIGPTNLADDAVVLTGTKVAALTASRLMVTDGSGKVSVRAFPAEGTALGGGAGGTSLADLILPAVSSDGNVTARSGTGYVTAAQLPLADLIAATVIYNSAAPSVIQATTGFTPSRPGTGKIKIDFATPFASGDAYISLVQIAGAAWLRSRVDEQLTDSCTIDLRDSDGNLANCTRCLITIIRVK